MTTENGTSESTNPLTIVDIPLCLLAQIFSFLDNNLSYRTLKETCKKFEELCISKYYWSNLIVDDELKGRLVNSTQGILKFIKNHHIFSIGIMNLSYNSIRGEGALVLGETLKNNKSLLVLDLRWNSIGDEGAKAIAAGLSQNCFIQHVNLKCNDIESSGMIAIANSLVQNIALKTIDLAANNLDNKCLTSIVEMLRKNQVLQELSVANNPNLTHCGKYFAQALVCNQTLRVLNIRNCGFASQDMEAFASSLVKNSVVIELNLESNHLNGAAIDTLFENLAFNTSIKRLNLHRNNPNSDAKGSHLSKFLAENKQIEALNLCGTKMGPESAKLFLPSLALNNSIVELNVAHCNIQDGGAAMLMEVVNDCKFLKVLNLSGNNISKSFWLSNNTVIESLDLSLNPMGKTLGPLIDKLNSNSSLTRLNISSISLSESVQNQLIESLPQIWYLKWIKLGGYGITLKFFKALANLFLEEAVPSVATVSIILHKSNAEDDLEFEHYLFRHNLRLKIQTSTL